MKKRIEISFLPEASIDTFTIEETEKFEIKDGYIFIYPDKQNLIYPEIGINLKSVERYTVSDNIKNELR